MLRAGRSGDRFPDGGNIVGARPDISCGPPSLLYKEYRVITGGKSGRGVVLKTHTLLKLMLKKG
jgi:hypothetical protein